MTKHSLPARLCQMLCSNKNKETGGTSFKKINISPTSARMVMLFCSYWDLELSEQSLEVNFFVSKWVNHPPTNYPPDVRWWDSRWGRSQLKAKQLEQALMSWLSGWPRSPIVVCRALPTEALWKPLQWRHFDSSILYCSLDGILVSSREGSLASPEFDPSWSWNAHYLIVIQLWKMGTIE